MKIIRIIGVASGWGALDRRCEAGPEALRRRGLVAHLRQQGMPVSWEITIQPQESQDDNAVMAVQALSVELSQVAGNVVARGEPFIVLGGDHSCAIGTWSGAVSRRRIAGPVGLIWIDAHMDAHLPETSPSGALHGMPLACLLGWGDPRLTAIGSPEPKFLPENVVLIGVRSFEPEEHRLLQRLGVKVFFMDEVRRRGLSEVFYEALGRIRDRTTGFGISLDLDAIDPKEAPAVGSPVPGGLAKEELLPLLRQLYGDPRLIGLEIAEYNPALDEKQLTARLISELLLSVFAPLRLPYESYHRAGKAVLSA
ncbi:arginase [Nitrosococcus oceani]|uniref:Arginase n=2 Tax=Nitrosococcus oceani TaxID=1229 RepID=Q3JAG2_NITOC|nr:arginase [Nitrosococcus oceani]KFI19397.1 arginase [Nitrosococcus oceani C-27]ABA58184.1 arginase [Nitrosococcus oceani ATCC 19707]EDZ67609.1 Arginase family [Nitrosococcus oceani AFC27]KFI22679.1 arginase [Nitrosococcus oceani]GEM20404.1 arginase [Nitrosococcus oceani]